MIELTTLEGILGCASIFLFFTTLYFIKRYGDLAEEKDSEIQDSQSKIQITKINTDRKIHILITNNNRLKRVLIRYVELTKDSEAHKALNGEISDAMTNDTEAEFGN